MFNGYNYDVSYYTYGNAMDKLTSKRFFVKIPRIYIYTEEEKKLFGIPVDEVNGNIDKKSIMDLVDSYKNVYELAMIAYENATILIKNENDILEILELANEAINILEKSPNVPNNENSEDLIFALKTLIEKIKETNGNYLRELYRRNDPINKYLKETFGGFEHTLAIKNRRPMVTDINPTPNSTSSSDRVYGIDFEKISL